MDTDTDDGHSTPICDVILDYTCRHPGSECPLISGIFKAVFEGDLAEVRRWVESGGCVNETVIYYDYSLLHLAVVQEQVEMLEYLLTRDGIQVDCVCCESQTPLFLATEMGYNIKLVEKLIQAGADVNIADNSHNTALHMSVCHPDFCHLLLRHGALVDVVNLYGHTPLREAVFYNKIEAVHMLLYYNADVNVVGTDLTPFAEAVRLENDEAQWALLEYVDDFNRINYHRHWISTILSVALERNSPLVKDMIERGADVNYGDDSRFPLWECAFNICFSRAVDLATFEMVWEGLRCDGTRNTIDFLSCLDHVDKVPSFLQVIIDGDNFETAVECLSKGKTYFSFVNKFAKKKFGLDQLTALTCRLLEYGFRPSSYDVHAILSNYGYCDLFRILLYMDIDFSPEWLPQMALCRLIFDIHFGLETIVDKMEDIPKEDLLQLLEYSICPRLIDALTLQFNDDTSIRAILGRLSRVPSLIELARNAARKQIWQRLKITNNCQFYTTIDYLDIATLYKDILTFRRKIYTII